jgi:hypothetical protein
MFPLSYCQVHTLFLHNLDCLVQDLNYGPWPVTLIFGFVNFTEYKKVHTYLSPKMSSTYTTVNCVIYGFMNSVNRKGYHVCYDQISVPNWYLNFTDNHMTVFLYQFVMACFNTSCMALIVANSNCNTSLCLWSRVLLVQLINSGAAQEIPYSLWNMRICCHVHSNLPPVPVHSLLSSILQMHQTIILLSVPSLSSGFFP